MSGGSDERWALLERGVARILEEADRLAKAPAQARTQATEVGFADTDVHVYVAGWLTSEVAGVATSLRAIAEALRVVARSGPEACQHGGLHEWTFKAEADGYVCTQCGEFDSRRGYRR